MLLFQGYSGNEKEYVASQGNYVNRIQLSFNQEKYMIRFYFSEVLFLAPQPHTVNDIWAMVWQLKSNVIVMLTRQVEMGVVCSIAVSSWMLLNCPFTYCYNYYYLHHSPNL